MVVCLILDRNFLYQVRKDTLEVVGSIIMRSCLIGKDVACYVLKTPRGVILSLMSQLILTVAIPLNFILVSLSYAVLSAVMSCFICCINYCLQ